MDYQEMKERNRKHLENPQIGDFWHEMFLPYFIVIDVTKYGIIVLDETIIVDEGHYKFDDSKPKLMSKDDMRNKVTYSTNRQSFVADVSPREK